LGDFLGTDRTEYHREACPCGGGHLVIEWHEPDHSYQTSSGNWAYFIKCETCDRAYVLTSQDGSVILVRRADVEQRRALEREGRDLCEKIMRSPHARLLRQELEKLLDEQRSMAAAHRVLTESGVIYAYSIARFRDRVRHDGYGCVVDDELWAEKLPCVAALIGRDTAPIDVDLRRVKELRNAANAPDVPVGEPIFQLRR